MVARGRYGHGLKIHIRVPLWGATVYGWSIEKAIQLLKIPPNQVKVLEAFDDQHELLLEVRADGKVKIKLVERKVESDEQADAQARGITGQEE